MAETTSFQPDSQEVEAILGHESWLRIAAVPNRWLRTGRVLPGCPDAFRDASVPLSADRAESQRAVYAHPGSGSLDGADNLAVSIPDD